MTSRSIPKPCFGCWCCCCCCCFFAHAQMSCLYLHNAALRTPAQLTMSTGRAALLMASQRRSGQTGKTCCDYVDRPCSTIKSGPHYINRPRASTGDGDRLRHGARVAASLGWCRSSCIAAICCHWAARGRGRTCYGNADRGIAAFRSEEAAAKGVGGCDAPCCATDYYFPDPC